MSCDAPDPLFVFRGARSPVMSVTFLKSHEDSSIQHLAAGTQEGQVLIWDLKTKCLIREWAAHPGSSVLWIYSRSAEEIWTLGRHDKVKRWDYSQPVPEVLQNYSLQDYLGFSYCDMVIDINDRLLIAIPGSSQESITVFDVEKFSKICCLTPRDPKKYGNIMQMKWVAENSNSLLVAYESGNICIWDYTTCSVISEVVCTETPICICFDTMSRTGMVGTASEKLFTFHLDGDLKLSFEKEVNITNPGLSCCVARPDGKIFAAGGWDYRIRLFSSKKMKPLAVLLYHKKTVECLAYSPSHVKDFNCQYLLAAGSSDMSVSVWNMYN